MGLTKPRAAQIYNLDYKQATRVVTVVNITLAGGAPSTVDSVSLSLNDRVLVTAQTTGTQNGLYKVTTVGSGSNGTWVRTSDANDTGEIEAGMIIMVTEGTIYHDTQWKLTTDDPIIIGTTALTFTQNYSANSISGGTSNVTVLTNANVTISSAGTANVLVISSTGTIVTGTESVTGNATVGNLLTAGQISATGNITGNYFLGNVFYANGITASKIYSGNSEVNVTASGGNVNVSIGGTSNVAVWATTGEYITGLLSVTGNITGGNVLFGSGVISGTGNATAGNILTGGLLSATGNATAGNVLTGGLISATGSITGAVISIPAGALTLTNQGSVNDIIAGTKNVGQVIIGGTTQTGAITLGQSTANQTLALAPGATSSGNTKTITVGQGGVTGSTTSIGIGPANGGGFGTVTINANTIMAIANTSSTALSVAGNITSGNVLTGGLISATGNATSGNVLTGGLISATGNITGNYFLGNVFYANGITASKIYSGTSEVNVTASGGNVNVSIGGTSNVAVWSTTGEYITGLQSVTGNITGGNILTAGLISATGNATVANLFVNNDTVMTGNLTVNGNITYINSNVITTNEKSITLANNQSTAANVDGAGIDVGNTTIAYWRFNNATTSWQSNIGITPAANGTLNLGGASNYWANVYAGNTIISGSETVTGNATAGNVLTGGLISATANVTGGNIRTVGLVSATGNVTGNYFIGNGSALTGINAFGTVTVSGQSNIAAVGLNAPLTFAAGSNISITTGGNTVTIAYTSTSSSSIFATGGDMGLIANPVTASEDLGNVTTVADTSYDLGTLFTTVTYNQIDMTGFTANVNTGNLNAIGLANLVGNSTTGVGALYTGPSGYTVLPNVSAQHTTNVNSYSQINFQNINNGTQASTDLVLTAGNGNDSVYFADFGIASNTYAYSAGYTAVGPNDTYLFAAGASVYGPVTGTANLLIGSTNGNVRTFVGSANTANIVTVTANTGLYVTGVVSSTGNVTTAANAVVTGSLSSVNTFGYKNRLINGGMTIYQRGANATVVAGNTVPTANTGYYTADHWFMYSTGANVTANIVAGSGNVLNNLQITGAASVTAVGVGQRIEQRNCIDLANSVCTLSVQLSDSLLTTVTWTASYANTADTFGTIASPTKTQIATGTFTVNSTLTTYSTQISVPAAATTGIEILFTVGAQTSGTFVIGSVQFEKGTVATPFDYRDYAHELIRCQRYYQQLGAGSSDSFGCGVFVSTSMLYSFGTFPVTMRSAPTVGSSAVADWSISSGTVASNATVIANYNSQTDAWSIQFTGTGTPYTANQAGFVRANSAASRITFVAEIP